jgi:hypothetical protein
MPRVATGFVSFLALQVFRQGAYELLPKASSSLLWLDVTLINISVIMFLCVLENVVAQIVNVHISHHCATYIDRVALLTFPVWSVIDIFILCGMGANRHDPRHALVVTNVMLLLWLVLVAVLVYRFLRRLPMNLLAALINQLVDEKLAYRDMLTLDKYELSLIFQLLDADSNGSLSHQELVEKFTNSGLFKDRPELIEKFEASVKEVMHATATNEAGEIHLDDFRGKFASIAKAMHRTVLNYRDTRKRSTRLSFFSQKKDDDSQQRASRVIQVLPSSREGD